MSLISGIVKNSLKVVGTVSKIGIEITADAVGIVKENISHDEGQKDEFFEMGRNIGKKVKENIDNIGESAEQVIDGGIDTGKKFAKNITGATLNMINNLKSDVAKGTENVKEEFKKSRRSKDSYVEHEYAEKKTGVIIDVEFNDEKNMQYENRLIEIKNFSKELTFEG